MRPRENPFRVECLEALPYQFLNGSLDGLLSQLERQQNRGAIVGPHGHGKSTLMGRVGRALEERGETVRMLRITEANRSQQSSLLRDWLGRSGNPAGEFLFLDGAEQLTWWNWRRVRAASRLRRGFVITSHSAGLLPTLYECLTTQGLLRQLVSELTTAPVNMDLDTLFQRHQGNIRECLRSLYDEMSTQERV